MYRAKNKGRNIHIFYNERLQIEADSAFKLKVKLAQAFINEEFILHYQEQFDLNANLVGYEALMRWEDPDEGLVKPDKFLPYIDKFGLSLKLDKYICEKVYKDFYNLTKKESNIQIAINITGSTFSKKEFLYFIEQKVNEYKIDPSSITLEITEDILVENIYNSNISKLKDFSIKEAI